jgi:hypothetical protein
MVIALAPVRTTVPSSTSIPAAVIAELRVAVVLAGVPAEKTAVSPVTHAAGSVPASLELQKEPPDTFALHGSPPPAAVPLASKYLFAAFVCCRATQTSKRVRSWVPFFIRLVMWFWMVLGLRNELGLRKKDGKKQQGRRSGLCLSSSAFCPLISF